MIISSRKKFIFFHTPKAAGSSLNSALRKYANIPSDRLYNYLLDYVGTNKFFGVYPRHISPLKLSQHISAEVFNSYKKIAFVRNPFDWHVSYFHYQTQDKLAIFHEEIKTLDFEEYLMWAQENTHLLKSNQFEFLSDGAGKLMIDFLGRAETINESFDELKMALNITGTLPRKNQSDRSTSYRKYYSEEGRRLVEVMNAKDLSFFDYAF